MYRLSNTLMVIKTGFSIKFLLLFLFFTWSTHLLGERNFNNNFQHLDGNKLVQQTKWQNCFKSNTKFQVSIIICSLFGLWVSSMVSVTVCFNGVAPGHLARVGLRQSCVLEADQRRTKSIGECSRSYLPISYHLVWVLRPCYVMGHSFDCKLVIGFIATSTVTSYPRLKDSFVTRFARY